MPSLSQSLQTCDLGHLRIVAGLWGLEDLPAETEAALKVLTEALLDPKLLNEMVETLSGQALSALKALADSGGKIPWVAFERSFGVIRLAGPGRRDRERPYLNPVSISEMLFYRAFLARAFFDTSNGAQEFSYIPDDLLKLINSQNLITKDAKHETDIVPARLKEAKPLGRPAAAREHEHIILATDRILDDATTVLAALRLGLEAPEVPVPAARIMDFLRAAGIIVGDSGQPEQVKEFLEKPRLEALAWLRQSWQTNDAFNELHQVPGLACEGEWANQPLATRNFLFHLLEAIPEGKWWHLYSFILAIKEKCPDFQRPAGDYDSWFIKRLSDGAYLRGFASWDEVEGALLHYFVTGPLFWLGLVDLASPEGMDAITAFRIRSKAEKEESDLQTPPSERTGKLTVSSNGRITIPRFVPRAARYQITRFCEWDEGKPDEYRYHVTTNSLEKAHSQGLKVGQLLSLLARNAASEIPPAFVKALKRWERNGTEARLEVRTILRVSRPEILDELRKSKAGRFLGESLGPATVVVKSGAHANVLAVLAELGFLSEVELQN